MIGTTISHYRITAKLGEGGMGVVYKAEDIRLERPVALKFLNPASFDEHDQERLLKEARTSALIHHRNICPIYDVDEADGRLFFAMAYLEGQTLGRILREGPVPIEQAIHIAVQILEGLEEAHRHRVIHRDIKSGNVIVSSGGHAYILDFGLAISHGSARMTAEGRLIGTPAYMSPEQADGTQLDHRTDIWSTGVLLYEMLTGQLPFRRTHAVAVLHAILHDPVPPLSELLPEAPAELRNVVEKALEKDPQRRWGSAREMGAALQRAAQGSASMTTTEMHRPVSGAREKQSWPRRAWLTALPVLAIGAGAAWWFGYHSSLPGTKQVAVLPFQVIGADEDGMVRATTDGLVELLTAQLSQLDEFQGQAIVVPASEIRLRNIASATDARRIYGANLVIAGSAHRLNEKIQFTVTLVDAVKMRQLGARSFDFDANNPIALRDDALARVLNLLEVQFAGGRGRKRGDTSVPEAYAAYVQGTGYLARYDLSQNVDRAIASFQSALARDPEYALAYAGRADAYMRKATGAGEKQWSDRAVLDAEKAVRLGPELPAVHATLGRVYGTVGREDEAIREFQRALQISPGDVEVYRNLAEVLANLGRFTEAEGLYTEAVKRRPNDWYGHVLLGLFYKGREKFPEAEQAYRRAIALTPDNVIAYRLLGSLYKAEGKYPEAIGELQKALKIQRSALVYSVLGVSYYYERKFAEAAAALETAVELDPGRYTLWGNLGMTYQKIPDKKAKAEPSLRRAIELGEKLLSVTPKNYSIRGDLAEYWARLGNAQAAERQLDEIPEASRAQFAAQSALVYELIGMRVKALRALKQIASPSARIDAQNDPDLQALWASQR